MRKKILGGLYGQALGDAFAMPAQVHPDDTERAFGWLDSWQDAPADHIVHAGLPAGRITDDSEGAFSIAQAIIAAGAVTLEAAVAGLISWYDRADGDNSPYVGPSTRRALQALKAGADPRGNRALGRYQRRAHAHLAHRLAASGRYRGRPGRYGDGLHADALHAAGGLGGGRGISGCGPSHG